MGAKRIIKSRSKNGERFIDGKLCLLCGRWKGPDAETQANTEALALMKLWEFVHVVRRAEMDFACYVFGAREPA